VTRLWRERVHVLDEFSARRGLCVERFYDKKWAVIDAIMERKGSSDRKICGEKVFI